MSTASSRPRDEGSGSPRFGNGETWNGIMTRGDVDPNGGRAIRLDFQHSMAPEMRRRRGIVMLSLLGMASIGIVSLYQAGVIRHLPDPPWRRFNADKVNVSDRAYLWGVPNGTLSLATHAVSLLLAGFGSRDRATRHPWVPVVASAKAAGDAGIATWYLFYEMPVLHRLWCAYCIVDALTHMGTFALSVPEAVTAWRARRRPRHDHPSA